MEKEKKGYKYILLIFIILFLNTVYAAEYHVTTCQQLQDISPTHLADNVYLDNNIDCSTIGNFVPIGGDYPNCFSGFFYGNTKKISNLNQNQPNTRGGLFGLVCGGSIQDVGLEDVDIVITTGGGVGQLYAGALAGEVISLNGKSNVIQRVYAKGSVTASSSQPIAGGLIGYINWNGGNTQYSIANSYAQVNVNAGFGGVENIAGGFIGKIYALTVPISYCYSTGTVSAGTREGGLIGDYEAVSIKPVSASYWDTQTSGISTSTAGTGKTTAQMHQQTTFSGWDFINIWKINEGVDYPRQQWETCTPQCSGKNCGEDDGCGTPCLEGSGCTSCTSKTCSQLGKQCGTWDNGCGTQLNCPICSSGYECNTNGQCISYIHNCPGNNQNDIIMKLYQPKNSHGAIWDYTSYSYDICYSEIFGTAYPVVTGTNPHTCTATNTNKVLGLYSQTINSNSHAEIPTDSLYNTNVCYGNLVCRSVYNFINSKIAGIPDYAAGTWYPISSPGFEIKGITGNMNRGVVVSGGTNQLLYMDDFLSNTWKPVTSPLFNVQGITSEDIRNGIIAYGGTNNQEIAKISYPFDDSWISIISPGFAINGITGENSGGIIVYGGTNNQQIARIPNYAAGTWYPISSPGFEIKGITGNMNGGIVVFGGTDQLKYMDDFTQGWKDIASPLFNIQGITSEDIRNGIIVFGNDGSNQKIARLNWNGAGFELSWEEDVINPYFKIGDFTGENNRGLIAFSYEKEKVISDCDSAAGERTVVRLFQNTNSHISVASDADYPIKICCKPANVNPTSGLYWTNMNGNAIDTTDLNDRVKLIAAGLANLGDDVQYEIYNRDTGALILSGNVNAQSNNIAYYTWRASPVGNYYFKAKLATSIDWISSETQLFGILKVVSTEINSPPIAKIDAPKKGEIFIKKDKVYFNQSSYDFDDFLDYSWYFGDGSFVSGSTRDNINYNTSHTYTIDGQISINLNVTDERGFKAEDYSSILIIDLTKNSKYVFANISKPEFNSYVDITQIQNQVQFDAATSFAIEVIASPLTVNCLGGNCPAQIPYSPNPISISDPNNKRGDFSDLIFAWKFDDEDDTCDGVLNRKDCYRFNKIFSSPGQHFANLTVSLSSGQKGSTYTKFITILKNICTNGGRTWWHNDGTPHDTKTEDSEFCKGTDGVIGPNSGIIDDCCEAGYICTAGSTSGCQPIIPIPVTNIISCSNYTTLTSCESDLQKVGIAGGGGLGTEKCGKMQKFDNIDCGGTNAIATAVSCKCEWKAGVGADSGTCRLKSTISGSIFEGIQFTNTCFTTSTAEGCIDESMKVSEVSIIEWDPETINALISKGIASGQTQAIEWLNTKCNLNELCPNEERLVVCAGTKKLPFFTWINLVSAFVIIFAIYSAQYFIKRGRKKEKVKKK